MAVQDMQQAGRPAKSKGDLLYRHRVVTRATHWIWAISMLFLLMSGLQIFNAHPTLYIGNQSGFEFDNAVLHIGAIQTNDGTLVGQTTVLGKVFDTTGVLGVSGAVDDRHVIGFPSWLTAPSWRDLASGRILHFFFAWIFVTVFVVWFISSLINGHLKRDILPTWSDIKGLPQGILDHLRLKFHHDGHYNGLQKLAYAGVLVVLFPLIILTGLCMSPGMDAGFPWVVDLFGGRQTARTIHFLCMSGLVAFFFIHIIMVFAAGPINEMRSMITGWYRTDSKKTADEALFPGEMK